MPRLDLANADNWDNIWSVNAVAAPGARPWLHLPIPEQTVGVLVNSPLLAVYPEFTPRPNTSEQRWKFAGFAVQKFQLGISGTPAPTNVGGMWQKIWLNNVQFLTLANWQVPYGLSFQIPYWFTNWRCYVWEYTGPIPDNIDLLNQLTNSSQTQFLVLRSDLGDIEVKADQTLSQLNSIETQIDNLNP